MAKWGFEIEFCANYGVRERLNSLIPSGFEVGTDRSADYRGKQGLELRTNKIFKQGLPRNKFKKCFELIKQFEGHVHPGCGFHIHFSDCGWINTAHARNLLGQKFHWKQRDPYVSSGGWNWKYMPIRHIEEDHYEIRIFNSTLNMRGLCQMYKIARKLIQQYNGRF